MSPQTIAVHEQMLRHFSGVLRAIEKLLNEIGSELKQLKETDTEKP